LPQKRKYPSKMLVMIDEALRGIIDQWYLSVSDYYVTIEKKVESPEIEASEELKRFHDETGHRIKFAKGELAFTYGLSLLSTADECSIEVSVNNKVPEFNYGELARRLAVHYEAARSKPLEGFKRIKKARNCDIFSLSDDLQSSISIEQREGKADVVRLCFGLNDQYLDELIADPPTFMDVIHQYCVAPLRKIYAEVYRAKQRR
jgi:hypothetical protein